MALLITYLAIVCGSALAVQNNEAQDSFTCGRYFDINPVSHKSATFSLQPSLNDFMFTEGVLYEEAAVSEVRCGRKCVGAQQCVMFTFHRFLNAPLATCRLYGQMQTGAVEKEGQPGARTYALDFEAFGRLYNGYTLQSGRCIQILQETMMYQDAKQRCSELDGGHLFFAKTMEDINFGHSVLSNNDFENIWVGANDLAEEGHFTWDDGTPLPSNSYLWLDGEPNDGDGQDCVCIRSYFDLLDDASCAVPVHVVCQKDI